MQTFKVVAIFLVSLVIFGCASQEKRVTTHKLNDMKKARNYCYKTGLQEGSEQFENCVIKETQQNLTTRQLEDDRQARMRYGIKKDREYVNSFHDSIMDMAK